MGRYIRSILTKEVLYYFIVRQDMSSNSIAKKLVKLKIGAGMIILLAKEYGIETKSIRESNSTEDVKKKRSNTLKSRYGIDHQLQKESPFYLKRNQTVKDKYGVENVFQLEDVKKKSLNSMVERHGVKSSRNVPWYKPNNGKRSKSHQEIEKILTDLNVSFESEYGQKKEHKHFTKYNDYLKREYSPVVDILVPNKNTVIEIYDDNFHANPNLHKDEELIKRWGGVFTAKEIRDFDKSRKEQLESLGYKVIEIWRSDIRKNKKQVIANIKSFLELS
jgi:hypothetical protein